MLQQPPAEGNAALKQETDSHSGQPDADVGWQHTAASQQHSPRKQPMLKVTKITSPLYPHC